MLALVGGSVDCRLLTRRQRPDLDMQIRYYQQFKRFKEKIIMIYQQVAKIYSAICQEILFASTLCSALALLPWLLNNSCLIIGPLIATNITFISSGPSAVNLCKKHRFAGA